ncbi:MAG: hypothetical protein FJW35_18710 [Acidobacteria bacterium]|nr:hypothetical protein [Acidobacteriota bacterium]
MSNPTLLYVGLVLVGLFLILILGFLVRWDIRRRDARRLESAGDVPEPVQSTAAAEAEGRPEAPSPDSDGGALPLPLPFAPPSSMGARAGRFLLVLLAWCVAMGFLLVLLPQSTIDNWAQAIRLKSAPQGQEEVIAFLYLGDEMRGRDFHLRGVVRNISTGPVEKLDATVRLYSTDGALIETVVVRLDSETIAPDGTSAFHLTFPEYSGQFTGYSVEFKLRSGEPVPYKDMRGSREPS